MSKPDEDGEPLRIGQPAAAAAVRTRLPAWRLGLRRALARARGRAWLSGVCDESARPWGERGHAQDDPAGVHPRRGPGRGSAAPTGSPHRTWSRRTGRSPRPWRATRLGLACWWLRSSAGSTRSATALARNLPGTLPAVFGARLTVRRGQLFGRELGTPTARDYAARVSGGRAAPLAQWQMLLHRAPEAPVGDAPVLVVGSPDDRIVPRRALERAARRYGGAPLLFPGMGHDLMLDARWKEPIDAILDWLEKST